jgi:acetyltransferase-like isoleucine patch superfamily enzyme
MNLRIQKTWARFWMQFSGRSPLGRIATRLAGWMAPPYKGRGYLARLTPAGYISPSASIYHDGLNLGENVFIGDRVVIYQAKDGGVVSIGKGSKIHLGTIIETGRGGSLTVGADSHIQPRCQFSAYVGSIVIGDGVQIAPYCAFYPYNHQFALHKPIKGQPLKSQGDIVIDDDAWLGVGVTVMDNVHIGRGAVVGAGSVVTQNIPDEVIAAGTPARILRKRY